MVSPTTSPPRWHTWVYLVLSVALGGITSSYPNHIGLIIPAAVLTVVAIILRYRYPSLLVAVAMLAILAGIAGAGSVLLFAFAIQRRGRPVVWAMALTAAATGARIYYEYVLSPHPDSIEYEAGALALILLLLYSGSVVTPILLGSYVGISRERVGQLETRASIAEEERELRARDAVLSERQRIATEMHDSLGHRLALLTMQAGALEVNAGAGAEVVAEHAETMRATAREALNELRAAIGALSDDESDPIPRGTADLPGLIERNRRAGARITVQDDIDDVKLPETIDRTVFRLVQEGLTNAHKHAPGQAVHIETRHAADGGITVSVRNSIPRRAAHSTGDTVGRGLLALAERVRLVGGELRAETEDHEFVLEARLPLPTHAPQEAT